MFGKEDLRLIGIHGAPRSGTSWLGQILNSSEHVEYRYQPLFSYAFKGRLTPNSSAQEIRKFRDDLLATEDEFVLQRGAASLPGYSLEFPKTEITHLAYKEVRYHDILENLLAKAPDTDVIAIVRHPCAVLYSWKCAPREFEKEWKFRDEWRLANRKNKRKTENWYGFERWRELALMFEALTRAFPDRFHLVRYEDLVGSTEATISRLFHACGLEYSSQVENFIRQSKEQDDAHPYGVFRGPAFDQESWIGELDSDVIKEIYAELKDTVLERYLDSSRTPY